MVKKVISLLLVGFVLFYVLSFPTEASNMIKSAFVGLGDAATSFAEFLKSLV